jgi:hypothetical protein
MKNNRLPTVLLGITAFTAVASVALCYFLISLQREARGLQAQITGINNNRAIAGSLVAELSEYAKRNPSIEPVLQTLAPKAPAQAPKAAPTATPKPASK